MISRVIVCTWAAIMVIATLAVFLQKLASHGQVKSSMAAEAVSVTPPQPKAQSRDDVIRLQDQVGENKSQITQEQADLASVHGSLSELKVDIAELKIKADIEQGALREITKQQEAEESSKDVKEWGIIILLVGLLADVIWRVLGKRAEDVGSGPKRFTSS